MECYSFDTEMRRMSGSDFRQICSEGSREVLACEVSHVQGLRSKIDR